MTQKKIIETLKERYSYLRDNFGVRKIGLFGSFAKGIQTRDSDVDIFIELEGPMGLKFIALAEYIEKILGKKVDILTPEGIRSIRSKEIASDIQRNIVYV